jgi:hypothetical protein
MRLEVKRILQLVVILVAFVLLVALVINRSTSLAQSRTEEALYGQLTANGTASISVMALDRVLKTPEDFSAGILYAACGVAFREKRLEDAGFLLYIARFRARFDYALFPPTGTGGNSPMIAISALHQQLGTGINPAITAEPKVYAKVLARLKSWKPKVAASYEPGWEYSKKGSEKQAEEAVAANRKEVIDYMSGFSTLLQDAAYFTAFKTIQDYNFKLDDDNTRPSKDMYDAALLAIERIEKERGIESGLSVIKR